MDKKVDELKARYKKTLAELYLDKNIDYSPVTDCIFVKGMHSFGGYYEGTLKKGISSDVDDTLTLGESLTEKWIYGSSEINGLVRRIRDDLLNYLKKIPFLDPVLDKPAIKETIETVGKELAKCKFHYKEHKEASSYAAHEVKLAPYSRDFIHELDRIGYVVSLNSGSPEECVTELGRRLNITRLGIGWLGVYKRISGSRYKFGDDGYFTGEIKAGLDFNKVIAMKNFLTNIKCPPSLSIFVSDDPKLDAAPASIAGLTIWTVNRSLLDKLFGYKFPGEIKIVCPDAKKDMNILINHIKRWDLLNIVMYLRTPEAEKKLYDLAKRFEKITEDGMKTKEDFYIYKNEFSKLAHQLLGIVEPLITERNLNTFETLHELEMSDDIEMNKSLMGDIFNKFSYRIPEIRAPEKFGEELNSIAEEKKLFKDSDWWLPW